MLDSLANHRSYLRLVAGLQIGPHLRGTIDPSSVVQQTLLEAIQGLPNFRGEEKELVPWLRQILIRNILDKVPDKNRTLGSLQGSSSRLEHLLANADTSPSEAALKQERLHRLAQALDHLPEDQRTAVELKHLHRQSVADIADLMNRTPTSVAGLLRRGLKTLRNLLSDLK